MEEFLENEGYEDGQFPIPEENRTKLLNVSTGCDKRSKSMFTLLIFYNLGCISMIDNSPPFCFTSSGKIACDPLFEFLEKSADLVPQFNSTTCLIFDEDKFNGAEIPQKTLDEVEFFCGEKRDVSILNINYWYLKQLHYLLSFLSTFIRFTTTLHQNLQTRKWFTLKA